MSSKDRKPLFVKELDQISCTNYYCDYYYDAVNYDSAQISTYVEHDMMKIEIIFYGDRSNDIVESAQTISISTGMLYNLGKQEIQYYNTLWFYRQLREKYLTKSQRPMMQEDYAL